MSWCRLVLFAVLGLSFRSAPVYAQQTASSSAERAPDRAQVVREAVALGVFLPYTGAAALQGYRAVGYVDASYDTVREGMVQSARGELVVLGHGKTTDRALALALMAGGGYAAPDVMASARASGFVGLKLQTLRQALHGIDLTLAGRYTSQGFNLLPALVAEVLLSKRLGAVSLLANVAYGQSVRDDDRFASARATALVRLLDPLTVGLESRAGTDLERDLEEPGFEPQLELGAAGLLLLALDDVTLSTRAGFRAVRYRLQTEMFAGPEVGIAVATAF